MVQLSIIYEGESVEIDFNPNKVNWKNQNYGQYSYEGYYVPEIGETIFVKRHRVETDSAELICGFRDSESDCPYMPKIYGFYTIESGQEKHVSYIFMEMLPGSPLSEKLKTVTRNDCYEILETVLFSLQEITKYDHWFSDLDFRNVMFYKDDEYRFAWLIDIDSCLPSSTNFQSFLLNRGEHTNVNERYWGCVVKTAKDMGNFRQLSGKTVSQAAFIYFAVDLYFRTTYPNHPFNLKPQDLFKLMEKGGRYLAEDIRTQWFSLHDQLAENPEDGIDWKKLDTFVTDMFQFPRRLDAPKPTKSEEIVTKGEEIVVKAASGILGKVISLFR